MNEITPFEFQGHVIRAIDRDGEPWWVVSELGKALEIVNPRQVASRLDDDEKGVIMLPSR
jgi:prophage antirepressor-like protein